MGMFILGFIVGAVCAVGIVGFLIYRSFLKNMKVYK